MVGRAALLTPSTISYVGSIATRYYTVESAVFYNHVSLNNKRAATFMSSHETIQISTSYISSSTYKHVVVTAQCRFLLLPQLTNYLITDLDRPFRDPGSVSTHQDGVSSQMK